jgi:hypothetical protein
MWGGFELSPGAAEATSRYVLQHASSDPVAIAGITASSSSTRDPQWWDTANVTDGNPHSAWGPADGDEHPTLTFDLGGPKALTAIAIKMDREPMSFDVQAKSAEGWTTVATDVHPARYQMLDYIDLPDVTTDALRLVFHAEGGGLLVCEVEAFEGRAAEETHVHHGMCVRLAGTADLGRCDGPCPDLRLTFEGVTLSDAFATGVVKVVRPADGAAFDMAVTSAETYGDVTTLRGTTTIGGQAYDAAVSIRLCTCSEEGPMTAAPTGVVLSLGNTEVFSATDEGAPSCGIEGFHGPCTD